MNYRYVNANALVDILDYETQKKVNEMPCIYSDIEPQNQHIIACVMCPTSELNATYKALKKRSEAE